MEYETIHLNLGLAKYPLFGEDMRAFWKREKPIYDLAKTYTGFSREIAFADRFSVFPS